MKDSFKNKVFKKVKKLYVLRRICFCINVLIIQETTKNLQKELISSLFEPQHLLIIKIHFFFALINTNMDTIRKLVE